MRLVVGLGNPGEEYAHTPHNLGFLVVDRLAEQNSIRVTRRDSRALVGVGEINGQPVMLAKPQTFMNLSGTSIVPLMEKHELGLEDLVVVLADLRCCRARLDDERDRAARRGFQGAHVGANEQFEALLRRSGCIDRTGHGVVERVRDVRAGGVEAVLLVGELLVERLA